MYTLKKHDHTVWNDVIWRHQLGQGTQNPTHLLNLRRCTLFFWIFASTSMHTTLQQPTHFKHARCFSCKRFLEERKRFCEAGLDFWLIFMQTYSQGLSHRNVAPRDVKDNPKTCSPFCSPLSVNEILASKQANLDLYLQLHALLGHGVECREGPGLLTRSPYSR